MVNWFRSLFKRFSLIDPVAEFWNGNPTSTGVNVTLDSAYTCSAVYRAVAIISQALAGLPASVIQVQGKRCTRVDHYLDPLLNFEFNPSELAVLGRERVSSASLLSKAGYAEIQRTVDKTRVAHLNVIDTDRIAPAWVQVPGEGWRRFFKLDDKHWISDSDIIQIPGFGFDGLEGRSIVTLARESIGLDISLEQHGADNFAPGRLPAGYIKTGRSLTDPVKMKMRASWKEVQHKSNDIPILDEDYEFKPISLSNDDQQFLESRSFQVGVIARWFGIPPHMLGELKDANYNSIEHLGTEFKTLTLQPWVHRWEQELTRKLLSKQEREDGLRIDLDMDGLLRADLKTRREASRIAISTGLHTINEEREADGTPPSSDPRCDMHLIQTNIAGADGTKPNNAELPRVAGDQG